MIREGTDLVLMWIGGDHMESLTTFTDDFEKLKDEVAAFIGGADDATVRAAALDQTSAQKLLGTSSTLLYKSHLSSTTRCTGRFYSLCYFHFHVN